MSNMWNVVDYESPTARAAMRNAIHNIAYTVVNSNAMQGVAPGSTVTRSTAPWKYLRLVISIVLVALIAGLIVLMVRRANDEKIHPNLYKQPKCRGKKAE